MQYSEFIKQPQIESRFNSMLEKQYEYFKKKVTTFGLQSERENSVAIKMASVSTDIYFAELHNKLDKSE